MAGGLAADFGAEKKAKGLACLPRLALLSPGVSGHRATSLGEVKDQVPGLA
jgi:hypothetical protein